MPSVNIEGLDRAELLAALYNASKPQGMGFMHYDPVLMTKEEAESLLATTSKFDCLKGRIMKIDLDPSKPDFNTYLYNRDLGEGAAERVVSLLRQQQSDNAMNELVTASEAMGMYD